LLQIMAQLRDPEKGCPWDLKQTYATIVPYTLEEAYEVADAIEQGDMAELRDELGDLLFQVVFYSQIAREEGHFDFEQVAAGICEKMLRRHPHVFADAQFDDEHSLRRAWEETKAAERAAKQEQTDPSQLAGVTRALPALLRAHKLQKKAAEVGFDWPDVSGAFDKTHEEIAEVEQALQQGDPEHLEEELGDLLFAMVNIVRLLGFKAEHSLRRANDKFERRFRRMEQLLSADGQNDLKCLDLDTLEAAWEAAKREEKAT
jgi:MazG family protein